MVAMSRSQSWDGLKVLDPKYLDTKNDHILCCTNNVEVNRNTFRHKTVCPYHSDSSSGITKRQSNVEKLHIFERE